MVKPKSLGEKKGIIASDAIISILIILLFAGIITSLITNIVLESTKIKMNSQQIDFATELLEYTEKIPYGTVTEIQDSLVNYVNDKNADYVSAGTDISTLTTPYKIEINVENYNETEGNEEKLDLLKLITITVESNLRNKAYSTQITGIKKASMQEAKEMIEE